ncbi:hypothetical protein DY000_02014623 [Brassica cretica]|uniref:KOW domain-containing protein n=1 Tax=Brassica cretica TaxID=69181 RepID=A0ABQ7CPJ6_BRACR|nr:hypothetical protein DY000_02014623 [Brassica cretica]
MEMRELDVCIGDGDERARGLPEMEMEKDRARTRRSDAGQTQLPASTKRTRIFQNIAAAADAEILNAFIRLVNPDRRINFLKSHIIGCYDIRDNWEEGNPGSRGTSPQYQPGSLPSRAYEAPTPGSGWASTPGGSYSDAGTPRDHGSAYANAPSPYIQSTPGQPMTPSSTSYLPGTPGGQPMTPGTGLDVMSPVIRGDAEAWFMPDILVDIHKVGEDSDLGVIRDVSDGTCKVSLGSSGEGDTIMALPSELEIVPPRKNDRVKIVGGQFRGSIGKLIGIDGSDGIVKIEENLDVKILDLAILAKFVQP